MSQNGQTHFKNLAANAARFLKCFWLFWGNMHWRVKKTLWKLWILNGSNNLVREFQSNLICSYRATNFRQDPAVSTWFQSNLIITTKSVFCKPDLVLSTWYWYPSLHLLLKVKNRNTGTRYEICSMLTIKTPEQRQWCRSDVFIVNFEHISHLVRVFLLLTLDM